MNRSHSILNPTVGRTLALLVAIASAVWIWLGHTGDEVRWLKVEAPRSAIPGASLPFRIQVGEFRESTRLCVDLHWSSNRDSSNKYLASGGSKLAGKAGGNFDFEIMVRPMPELHYVHGLIYLSPTGNWEDHTFVAATDLIPVATNRLGDSVLRQIPVHPQEESPQKESVLPSPVLRWVTGVLLLIASALVGMTFRLASHSQETPVSARRRWLVLTAGLALASAWELFGLEHRLGSLARSWARAEDIYYPREWFQRAAVSTIIAAAIVTLRLAWRQRLPWRSLLFFFGLYLALATADLLSLHALDKYMDISWHAVSLVDGLKFVCAAAVLASAVRAKGWTRPARSTTPE